MQVYMGINFLCIQCGQMKAEENEIKGSVGRI